MAQPRRYVYKASTLVAGAQDVINLDWNIVPDRTSIVVDLVVGETTFSVEYTLDDINKGTPDSWRWLPTAGFPYGTTVDVSVGAPPAPMQWTLPFPVTAVRLNILTLVGGPLNFTVIQGHDI